MPEVLVRTAAGVGLRLALGIRGLVAGGMLFFQTNLKSGLGYSSVLNMS